MKQSNKSLTLTLASFLISETLTAVILRKPAILPVWKVKSSECSFFLSSCSHQHHPFYHTLFFSQQVPCLISLKAAYWAKHSTGGLLEAITQPHCPWSNYSKKKRTFLLFYEGAFPWLPLSPAVESSSAQLLLHSEPTKETKCPAETWWVPAYYQHRISDLLQAQKTHNLFSLLPTVYDWILGELYSLGVWQRGTSTQTL